MTIENANAGAGAPDAGKAAADVAAQAAAGADAGKSAEELAAAKAAEGKGSDASADGQKEAKSLMDDASADDKAAQDAEDKRILEAKEEDLSADDKTRKAELVKAKEEADKAAKENVVPEKYEFKVPEGMTLDDKLVEKITPILKEGKVSQAVAQKLADVYAETAKSQAAAYEKLQADNFNKFVDGLKKETLKELGADAKPQLALAAKARDRFASKELITKLNQSGLANDKDMINLFITVGKAISEHKVIEGAPAGAGEKNPIGILYDAKK
jgi:hypothetical protein